MRKIYGISLVFIVCIFVVGFAIGMKVREQNNLSQNKKQNEIEKDMHTVNENNVKTNWQTKWIIQKYDLITKKTQIKEVKISRDLVALERNQLEEKVKQYVRNPEEQDKRDGLIEAVLLSFSKDSVVLLKTYDSTQNQKGFYLKIENGRVIAFYKDQTTIFLETDLSVDEMSTKMYKRLQKGIYFQNQEELFAFLESYTS